MRLSAVYFKKHEFLFNEPQTINLGGRFFYEFILNKNNKLEILKTENKNFIDDFWGKNISLVSAIVGENGTGKTSILKEFIFNFDKFRNNTLFNNLAFVYELDENNFKVQTQLELEDTSLKQVFSEVVFQYYNPVLDYELKNLSSYINPSNIYEENLEEYNLKLLEYQIVFNYSSISEDLKALHKNDFPRFGSILIKARHHSKEDFKRQYALSNLQDGMSKYLNELFNKYPNFDKSSGHLLHNQSSIIKNIEVTMLAILIINNTYPDLQGLGNSKYSIEEILESDDFHQILSRFKDQYISLNSTQQTYKKYEDLSNEEFKQYIENSPDLNQPHFNGPKRIIKMFEIFERFYNELLIIQNKEGFTVYENNLFYSNKKTDELVTNNMVHFMHLYQDLLRELHKLNVKNSSLLEFGFYEESNQNRLVLSNGEKALLNLYSIIYRFSFNSQIKLHKWDTFIFLFDEADLGFHPEWKKRFIDSITTVLPKILKEVELFKNIQVIFTTHDPLTLSDIPNSNIVYLKKSNGRTRILSNTEKPKKSFGANITDLLSDSFFITDGFMGNFAKNKIQKVIDWLNSENIELSEKEKNKKVIELIDEPILKRKLSEMFSDVVYENLELEIIEKEIESLNKRKEEIKNKI